MVDRLHVDVERVLGMSKLHDAVSQSLGGLQPADAPALDASHGVVASPVSSAVGSVLANRGDILRSTSTSGQQISSLLQGAADAYRSGDEEGARRMTAAAEAMDGPPGLGSAASGPGAPTAGAPPMPGAPAAGGGAEFGQALGQIGQVVQSVTQPIQGLAQALGQLPGQLLGGLAGGGGLGDAAGLGAPLHGAPMEHSAPVGHSAPMGHATPGHHGTDGGPGHPGDTDLDHAHELTRDGHDGRDDLPADPDRPDEESDESPDAAQELSADAAPARRPARTVPQD